MASFKRLALGGKKVSVPNQTLPRNLATLFKLPKEVLEDKYKASSNSLKNLRLHKYYQMSFS
jgi:spermidine synthase